MLRLHRMLPRMDEYDLKEMWNAKRQIRAILDGTVFRAPILVKESFLM